MDLRKVNLLRLELHPLKLVKSKLQDLFLVKRKQVYSVFLMSFVMEIMLQSKKQKHVCVGNIYIHQLPVATPPWEILSDRMTAVTLLQHEDTGGPNMNTPSVWWGNSPDGFLISLVDHRTRWARTVWSATVYVCVCVCVCVCVSMLFLKEGGFDCGRGGSRPCNYSHLAWRKKVSQFRP